MGPKRFREVGVRAVASKAKRVRVLTPELGGSTAPKARPATKKRQLPASQRDRTPSPLRKRTRLATPPADLLRRRLRRVPRNLEIASLQAIGLEAEHVRTLDDSSSKSDSDFEKADEKERRTRRQRVLEARRRCRAKHFLRHHLDPSAGQTFLEASTTTAATAERYQLHLDLFLAYTEDKMIDVGGARALDSALTGYFNVKFFEGHQANFGELTMAGLIWKMPRFGRLGDVHLPSAWLALKGWRKRTPGRSRRPHTLGAWAGLAVDLAGRGFPQMSLLVLLMVSAYLRPMEGFRILRCDMLPPTANATAVWSLLIAPEEVGKSTKTGTFDESIALDSKWLKFAEVAWEVLSGVGLRMSAEPLWSFTWPIFWREFQISRKRIGLRDMVPYMARHSGASLDRAVTVAGLPPARTQEEVRRRGRWKAHRSMVRYEKAARLAATARSYSPEQTEYFRGSLQVLADVVLRAAAPPRLPSL